MGQNETRLEQFLIPEEQFTTNVRTILFEPTRCAGIQAITMDRNLSVKEQKELLKRRWIFDEDGYWRKDRRIFIPSGTSIEKTIKEHHDTLYAGHPGIRDSKTDQKTWILVANDECQHRNICQRMHKMSKDKDRQNQKGWTTTPKYCTNGTMGRNIN
jgi:hypothetical protein